MRATLSALAAARAEAHARAVNFFGHATIAAWHDDRPAFVLGAMLPDFQGMLRLGAPAALDAALERGVALHHATDAAFHALPRVVELMGEARRALLAAGVARGPARAVGHIGTEILLDEAFVSDRRAAGAYLAALELGGSASAPLAWPGPSEARRFEGLIRALSERGVPPTRAPAELVAARLRRALSPRERLALDDREESLVRDWVVGARPRVVGCAVEIVSELGSRLAAAGFRFTHSPSLDLASSDKNPEPSSPQIE